LSADADTLRDEIELLTRSLVDARAEHARGELDDEGLETIERRDGARLAAAAAELAALAPEDPRPVTAPGAVGPRRHPLWLLGVAGACLAVVVGVLVVAAVNPFARAVHPRAPTTTTGKVRALLYEAELLVKGQHQLRALTAYDAVLSLAPRNPEALVESGWLRYEFPGLGAHDAAQVALGAAELARAVRLAPRSAAAHLYWGIVLYQHDHDDRAARAQLIRAASLPESKLDQRITETFMYLLSG
jgi:hypothetical protein